MTSIAETIDEDATTSVPQSAPIVKTIGDAFGWAQHHLQCIGGSEFHEHLRRRWTSGSITTSSAFSGIGAPEHSIESLMRHLFIGSDGDLCARSESHSLAACEFNQESRAELLVGPSPPQHIYCDQVEFVSETVRAGVRTMMNSGRLTMAKIKELLWKQSIVKTSAYCQICKMECEHPCHRSAGTL